MTAHASSALEVAIAADPEAARLRDGAAELVAAMRPSPVRAVRAVVAAGHSAASTPPAVAAALGSLGGALARLDRSVVLIGGGTRTGVNGTVGDAAQARGVPAEGFLPHAAVESGEADLDTARYHLHVRDGAGFSALDAIAYWQFLAASGIAPGEVRLVGVGGGAVSRVEYLLALRLGAAVGLFAGTGEAADHVLDCQPATRLLPRTVGPFITASEPPGA